MCIVKCFWTRSLTYCTKMFVQLNLKRYCVTFERQPRILFPLQLKSLLKQFVHASTFEGSAATALLGLMTRSLCWLMLEKKTLRFCWVTDRIELVSWFMRLSLLVLKMNSRPIIATLGHSSGCSADLTTGPFVTDPRTFQRRKSTFYMICVFSVSYF